MFEVFWLTVCIILMIILHLKGVELAIAVFLSSTLFLFLDPLLIPHVVLNTLTNYRVMDLAFTIGAVGILTYSMETGGQIDGILSWFSTRLKERWIAVVVPLILGLIPSPGGTLMSANILKELSEKTDVLGLINVWYKRVVGLIHPLMPSLILISKLTHTKVQDIIVLQIPIFLFALVMGLFLLRDLNISKRVEGKRDSATILNLLPLLIPITFTLLGLPILLSICLGIISSMCIGRARVSILKGFDFRLFFTVIGIFYFVEAIRATEILQLQIDCLNKFLLLVTFPFMTAYFIGTMFGSVAISFIILSPFIASSTDISLFYVSSVSGSILSPLNISNVLTMKELKVSYISHLKLAFLALPTLLIHSIIIFLISLIN